MMGLALTAILLSELFFWSKCVWIQAKVSSDDCKDLKKIIRDKNVQLKLWEVLTRTLKCFFAEKQVSPTEVGLYRAMPSSYPWCWNLCQLVLFTHQLQIRQTMLCNESRQGEMTVCHPRTRSRHWWMASSDTETFTWVFFFPWSYSNFHF